MLSQYCFLANEKHKELKNILSKPEVFNIEDLGMSYIQLDEYLYEDFGKAFDKNTNKLFDFFALRNQIKPRACIKIIVSGELVVLYRNPEFEINNDKCVLQDNTAFLEISKGKSYYLSNDIPADIKNKRYINKRISRDKVLEYLDGKRDWESCWEPIKVQKGEVHELISSPSETHYKSTMVIPMSLRTQDIDVEFKKHFSLTKVPIERERIIFGFLCLDHQDTNFFEPEIDKLVGYIFADLLSLYLIQQLTHTEYSEIYRKSKKYLDEFL